MNIKKTLIYTPDYDTCIKSSLTLVMLSFLKDSVGPMYIKYSSSNDACLLFIANHCDHELFPLVEVIDGKSFERFTVWKQMSLSQFTAQKIDNVLVHIINT